MLVDKEICSKNWEFNFSRTSEAIILLYLVNIIREKIENIEEEKIIVAIDNSKIKRIIDRLMKIANHFNKDAAAECVAISRLKKEVSIDIDIIKVYIKKKIEGSFH